MDEEEEEENSLSAILKSKLSKTEVFLVKAKIEPKEWSKTEKTEDMYLDESRIMGIGSSPLIPEKEYIGAIVNFEMLRKMLLWFKRNGVNDFITIQLHETEDGPLVITDGNIWGDLAPRIEKKDDEDED